MDTAEKIFKVKGSMVNVICHVNAKRLQAVHFDDGMAWSSLRPNSYRPVSS